MRALEFLTGHVIYNPVYTYKFQLKTTLEMDKNCLKSTETHIILHIFKKLDHFTT